MRLLICRRQQQQEILQFVFAFFHVPHFSYSAFYPTFRSTFPHAEFRILHVRDFLHSAFYRCPTLPCIVRCGGGAVFLLCPSVNTATCVVHNKHNHICIKHTAIYYLFYLLAPKIITTESETKINKPGTY